MDITGLIAVPNKHLPNNFSKAVSMLTRPYSKLTEKQVEHINSITEKADTDVLQDSDGRQYTWGYADGCTQLMPIQGCYKYK